MASSPRSRVSHRARRGAGVGVVVPRSQGAWGRPSIAPAGGWREAFWSRMQVDLLDGQSWRTRIELANAIFEYLEIWHA